MTTPRPTYANQPYSTKSHRNILDVYLPQTQSGPFPVVVFIHGGAFMHGDKTDLVGLSELLDAGYAVASINYRLWQHAVWPAQLNDIKAAIFFLRSNTNRLNIDGNRMATFGPSAGGHLASVTGIALAASRETRLQASIDWFGPIDFTTMDADMEASGHRSIAGPNSEAGSPESKLIGAPVKDQPTLALAASPLTYLDNLPCGIVPPPFLIMHGVEDNLIAPAQSMRLRDALERNFGPDAVEFHLLEYGGHGDGEFKRPETMATVIKFLNRHLKERPVKESFAYTSSALNV